MSDRDRLERLIGIAGMLTLGRIRVLASYWRANWGVRSRQSTGSQGSIRCKDAILARLQSAARMIRTSQPRRSKSVRSVLVEQVVQLLFPIGPLDDGF